MTAVLLFQSWSSKLLGTLCLIHRFSRFSFSSTSGPGSLYSYTFTPCVTE
jgi:hypothetical protein